jgi:hypothetical protein
MLFMRNNAMTLKISGLRKLVLTYHQTRVQDCNASQKDKNEYSRECLEGMG